MTGWSIRLRLTVLVSVLFGVALVMSGLLLRTALERALVRSAEADAEAILADVLGGSVVVDDLTRIVLLDPEGREIDLAEFDRLLLDELGSDGGLLGGDFPGNEVLVSPGADVASNPSASGVVGPENGGLESMILDGVDLDGVDLDGADLDEPTESPIEDDAGIVFQGASVVVGEDTFTVGVATPRGPIDDTLRTVTVGGSIVIPLLTLMIALVTWLTTGRALGPVEAIRRHVETTDPARLDRHVQTSGSRDEIDRLAGTMNDMLDRLHDASERHRRFISDASHELRGPITATLATMEMAERTGDNLQTVAPVVIAEQERLARLVDDLLLLARLDETRSGPATHEVDLDELALAEGTRSRRAEVTVRIAEPQRIVGDPHLLERCLANLVDNAAHHAESRVDVSVGANARGQSYVRVDDDGPGVPMERRAEIFERFTRVDAARNSRDGGAGLGLAIARDIADRHGAELDVVDGPLGGARFELRFTSAAAN